MSDNLLGISVYQMMLGSFLLLRRIDTDFVNLSPIVAYSRAPYPVLSTIPNATVISKSSPVVSGTWVPLSAAQAYVRDHPLSGGVLDVFLSDVLFERFPKALQDFHRTSTPGRMLKQFGPHFGSTLQAVAQLGAGAESHSAVVAVPEVSASASAAAAAAGWAQESSHSPFSYAVIQPPGADEVEETPLNETEQEIFHELCAFADWEKEKEKDWAPCSDGEMVLDVEVTEDLEFEVAAATSPSDAAMDVASERSDRPLRRSKRVADAIAARTRTRSRRRGSRNSLS